MPEHGIIDLVSRAEGGPFYTRKQVADRVGRSIDTVTRWGKKYPKYHPTNKMPLGKSFVWLYTEADIERLSRFADSQMPGRKADEDVA